jgi:HlyD family secretion protein
MRKKIIIPVAILIVIVGVVLGFTVFKNGKNNKVKYKMEAIAKGDIEALVVSSGTLNPVTMVDVGSQVSGKIAKIYVDFNSPVKQGEIVAELDTSNLETQVQQSEANYKSSLAALDRAKVTLDNLKKKYDRALNLFEKNLISYEDKEAAEAAYLEAKSDVQSSQARLEQTKQQLESSKLNLSYAIIRSPIDGVVISRSVNAGQTVAASFQAPVLFQVANDLTRMQVECSVDEADIGQVKEGQQVKFTVQAYPNDVFKGTVIQVRYSPVTTQNVVTYTTIVGVNNPDLKLRPGMTATVSIVSGEAKNVLRVPNSSLRFTPDLSPEQMQEIMKNMQAKFAAQRSGAAGARPQGPSSGPQAGSQGVEGRGQEGVSRGQDMLARSQGGGSGKQPSRVWVQDKDGNLSLVFIRPGVTDNNYTEVKWGDLKEGQMVITGLESGTTQASSQSTQPGGQRRMMFMPPPR